MPCGSVPLWSPIVSEQFRRSRRSNDSAEGIAGDGRPRPGDHLGAHMIVQLLFAVLAKSGGHETNGSLAMSRSKSCYHVSRQIPTVFVDLRTRHAPPAPSITRTFSRCTMSASMMAFRTSSRSASRGRVSVSVWNPVRCRSTRLLPSR